ncbi:MAG: hypothetical protein IT258_21925 [Saprospiraceae bacterium]|nr:hypothetical protein [Saprospiraceae bacterium]
MQQDYLLPLADAERLIAGFNACTLPKEEWTHEAHLIGGLWMLSQFGDKALDEMRTRIKRFNESVGGVNDDQNGYHETLTVFWLWALREMFADDDGKLYWNQDAVDDIIFDETLADRNLWAEFYSKERMMSVEARRQYVAPDLKPMD